MTARRFRLVLSGGSAAEALPPIGGRRADPARAAPRPMPSWCPSSRCAARAGAPRRGEGRVRRRPRLLRGRHRPARGCRRDRSGRGHRPDRTRRGRHAALGRSRRVAGASCGSAPRSPDRPTAPHPRDSTGLEVDKLDGERVAAYLETHLTRFGDGSDRVRRRASARCSATASKPARRTGPTASSSTSPRLRGYDPLRWLPALAGYLVGDADESDRFLFDYRRTLAELLRGSTTAPSRRRHTVAG